MTAALMYISMFYACSNSHSSIYGASLCLHFMTVSSPIKASASCLLHNKLGCSWLKVTALINKPWFSPRFLHCSHLLLWRKCICCSLLLVVSGALVNKEVDKLWSSIRILLQLITDIKEIIVSAKHWFFCSHYTPCQLNLTSIWCHFQWICLINVYVGRKMLSPSSIALCR